MIPQKYRICTFVKRCGGTCEEISLHDASVAIAWQWAEVASPDHRRDKTHYLDDAAGAFAITLSAEDLSYLEEPYVPHRIVQTIDRNPPKNTILLGEKK